MQLNADFGARVVVHADRLPWVPSPSPGVERRMLDRLGGEVARATSIVRYAAGSAFPRHVHGGGEEYLVLDGIFEDEAGAYPPGTYVRNPPGTAHAPATRDGCTIFVKLWQFDPDDLHATRINTSHGVFSPAEPGIAVQRLHDRPDEHVCIETWSAGASVQRQIPGGLELLVLDGALTENSETLTKHSWLRLPPGAALRALAGPEGCRIWVKTGHLLSPRAPGGE